MIKQKQRPKKNTQTIKIIRTIESFYPVMSGPANQAYYISKLLTGKQINTRILTSNVGAETKPKKELLDKIQIQRFPAKVRFMKYFYTPSMKSQMKDFDIVCGHSFRSYQTQLGYAAAKKANKPFVLHNHGSIAGYNVFVRGVCRIPYAAYDTIYKKIVLDADAIVVNTSQEFKEVIKYGVKKNRIHIIPVGIDVDEYLKKDLHAKRKTRFARKTKDENSLTLLCVARLSKDRNLEPVIKAVKILTENKINCVLRIVGKEVKRTDTQKSGYVSELKQLAKKLGVSNKIIFTGAKYGSALKEEYQNADVFVYTSLWENFGQAMLEASAAGLPMIATRTGIAQDIISNKTMGRLVGFNDPQGIVNAVNYFSDIQKRNKAKKLIIKKIKQDYSWKDISKKYYDLYTGVITR